MESAVPFVALLFVVILTFAGVLLFRCSCRIAMARRLETGKGTFGAAKKRLLQARVRQYRDDFFSIIFPASSRRHRLEGSLNFQASYLMKEIHCLI
jgi:hypothetical protein